MRLHRFGSDLAHRRPLPIAKGVALLACALQIGPVIAAPESQDATSSAIHVIVDSGSTGTRLCAFEVESGTASGPSSSCSLKEVAPRCVRTPGGLASATAAMDAAEASAHAINVLDAGFQILRAQVPELAVRGANWAGAALGTGGYRNPESGEIDDRAAWQAVWRTSAAFLQAQGATEVTARAITGAEEAVLAWQGTNAALMNGRTNLSVVELGGATTQMAHRLEDDPSGSVKGWSVTNGVNTVFLRLRQSPNFGACHSPSARQHQDADRCIALIRSSGLVDWPSSLMLTRGTVALLGASFGGTLKDFGASSEAIRAVKPASAQETGSPGTMSESAADTGVAALVNLTRSVCPLDDSQVLTIAPRDYHARQATGMGCFALSLQAATLIQLGADVPGIQMISGGDDQWARGAAISPQLFKSCSVTISGQP